MLLAMLAFGIPSLASAQIPDSAIPLKTVHDEINRFRAEYSEYYNAKNVAALVPMYATDAIVTTQDGSTYVGQAAIKAFLTKQAPTFPHLVITSDSLIGYGSTAIDVGTTKEHPQGGGERTSRYLVVLRRNMGTWTIVRLAVVPVMPEKM
jgi:ketosteroid isomerase-like protein